MNPNYNNHTDASNHRFNGTMMNGYHDRNNNDKNRNLFINGYPTKLLSAQRKIQKYNAKLESIENNTSKELKKEIQRLQNEKQIQLQLLQQFKCDDINDINDLYQPQIQQLRSQQKENMDSFNTFCLKELEKTKQEIQETQKPIDIDFESLYTKFNESHYINTINNHSQYRMSRNQRVSRHKKRLNFPPNPSLNAYEIDHDLGFLINEAKKQKIEIDEDIMMNYNTNRRRTKRRVTRKEINYKELEVSEEDMNEIKEICKRIGIELFDRALTVRLYGFNEHIEVYQDIFYWINNCDQTERNKKINALKTNKLRDIQVKLGSTGTVGVKLEMQSGIKTKLNFLANKYQH